MEHLLATRLGGKPRRTSGMRGSVHQVVDDTLDGMVLAMRSPSGVGTWGRGSAQRLGRCIACAIHWRHEICIPSSGPN
eukprot:9417-Eustigmatos_ZCMA.PRE.1